MKDTKYCRDDHVICPHCDHLHIDSWEFSHDGTWFCERCDKEFYLSIETTVMYVTSKE